MNCAAKCFAVLVVVLSASVASADILVEVNPITGRFIRVRNDGAANRLLHIGEIEAFMHGVTPAAGLDNANDLALGSQGASFHSSVGTGGHGNANDVFDGALQTGAAVWTRGAVNAEYVLDLGTTRTMGAIRTWQRADGCCQERLSDFTVDVLADNAGSPGAVTFSQSQSGNAPTNSFAEFGEQSLTFRPGGVGTIGTEVFGEAPGRFISVRNDGAANRLLHIGEIEAFLTGVTPAAGIDNANDVALGTQGASFESEVGGGGHGSVNAVFDGVLQTGGATWTRQTVNAEYVLDLGQGRDLSEIRVWQRADGCCQERLSDFTVSVLGNDGSGNPGATLFSQSFSGEAPTNSFATFAIPDLGPYELTLDSDDTLQIEIDPGANVADLALIGPDGLGDLTLVDGATLELIFLNEDFTGEQTFDILDFGSFTGSFGGNIIVSGINDPNIVLDLSNLQVNGQFSSLVTPEPTSIAAWLLIAAFLGMVLPRWRKR